MAEDRVDRRLAAIFAGDIAGYSRLMGVDEEGTLRQLKAHRKELVDPKITEHRGRIVKTTGDGMLVEFGAAPVDIQRGMLERNADVPVSRGSLSRNASGIVASVSADTTAWVPGMPMRSPMNPAAGGEAAAAPIVIV
jgi:class 3 adenylate cyclase